MLDAAVALYRARFRRLIVVAAVVVVPVQVLSTIVLLSAQPDQFTLTLNGSTSPQYSNESAAAQLGGSVVVLLVNLLSTAFVVAVCTRIVADAYIDHREERGEAVHVARRRFWAVMGLSLVVAITEALGLGACIVGAVVPFTLFAVAVPVLILEGVGVSVALARSVVLTRSHFFRVLGLMLTAQALSTIVNLGLALGISAWINHGANTTAAIVVQGGANAIAAMLTTPFLATATVTLYFDLRIREEGYDVQLLMQRNDARVAA
jgi:hypothetical protein